MNPIWFVRMARWARNPPSWGMVMLVTGVIVAALAIYGVERLVGWPDWLTVDRKPVSAPRLQPLP
jgi:hypothetical protein